MFLLFVIGVLLLIGVGIGLFSSAIRNYYFLIQKKPIAAIINFSLIIIVFFLPFATFIKSCLIVFLISLEMIRVTRMKTLL